MNIRSVLKTWELNKSNGSIPYLFWVLLFILMLIIINYFNASFQGKLDNKDILYKIENKLFAIEEQIKRQTKLHGSYMPLQNQLNDILNELSYIKYNSPNTENLEKINQKLQTQNNLIIILDKKIERINHRKSANLDYNMVSKNPYYVVRNGDTLTRISKRIGISVWELKEINNIDSNNIIFPGQKLKIAQ